MNTFSQFQVLSSRAGRVFNWPPLHHVTRFACDCFFGFLMWLKVPASLRPGSCVPGPSDSVPLIMSGLVSCVLLIHDCAASCLLPAHPGSGPAGHGGLVIAALVIPPA